VWFITIVFGVALGALGSYGYVTSDTKSLTALIPSAFGAVLFICGVLARNDHWRKHVMHAAVLVGLIGFLIPAIRVAMKLPESSEPLYNNKALLMQTIMAAICLVFVLLCINSFVQARLARRKVGLPGPE
jgi:hypothetical protein